MDEPLSNLDAKLRVQMRTEVARIQRRLGTTMVYVTHDQTEAMTLGDRVAVMRAGIIQQVDSPATLYDDPINLFVAGFIGSPSMNFLPGRLEGDKLELPFGAATVPERLKAALKAGGGGSRDVIVGVRPEHFEDAAIEPDRPGLMKFKAKIDVVESMGSELYVYFDVETKAEMQSDDLAELAKDSGMEDLPSGGIGQHVVARLDSDSKATPGGETELVLDTEQIKLFDPDGGRSLTYSHGNGAGAKAASAATPA
jgi:multiple sugar transport system ATP-binding protein